MPYLTIGRSKAYADKCRKYRMLLDGEEIGRIGEGRLLHIEIAEGAHTLQAKIDWCGSRPLHFEAHSEEEVFVDVVSALRGRFTPFRLWKYLIFDTRGYLLLEQLSDRPTDASATDD